MFLLALELLQLELLLIQLPLVKLEVLLLRQGQLRLLAELEDLLPLLLHLDLHRLQLLRRCPGRLKLQLLTAQLLLEQLHLRGRTDRLRQRRAWQHDGTNHGEPLHEEVDGDGRGGCQRGDVALSVAGDVFFPSNPKAYFKRAPTSTLDRRSGSTRRMP